MFHWNLRELLFQKGILLYTYMVTGYFASCIDTHTRNYYCRQLDASVASLSCATGYTIQPWFSNKKALIFHRFQLIFFLQSCLNFLIDNLVASCNWF